MTVHAAGLRTPLDLDRTGRAVGIRSWRRLVGWLRQGQLGAGYTTSWPSTQDHRSI